MKKKFYVLRNGDEFSFVTELQDEQKNNVVYENEVEEIAIKLNAARKINELKREAGLLEEIPVKELPEHFIGKGEVSGFLFDLIYKDNDFYVYRVENNYYEIFDRKVKYNKVKYPTGEDFGEWAWTFTKIIPMIKFIRGHYGKQLDPSIFE